MRKLSPGRFIGVVRVVPEIWLAVAGVKRQMSSDSAPPPPDDTSSRDAASSSKMPSEWKPDHSAPLPPPQPQVAQSSRTEGSGSHVHALRLCDQVRHPLMPVRLTHNRR